MPRHALHAKSLGFHHPNNDEWMQFDSDLPSDLSTVIDRWRNYTEQRIQKVGSNIKVSRLIINLIGTLFKFL